MPTNAFAKAATAALLITCSSFAANASSISLSLSASPTVVAPGETVTIDVNLNVGSGAEITDGIFNLFWDSTLTFSEFIFTPENAVDNPVSLAPPTMTTGAINGLEIFAPLPGGLFGPPVYFNTGDSLIGQLILVVTGSLPTEGALISASGEWIDSGFAAFATSAQTTITGVVPIPAAAWMFISALLGLGSIRKLKTSKCDFKPGFQFGTKSTPTYQSKPSL